MGLWGVSEWLKRWKEVSDYETGFRNFSLDVILLDALGQPVNKEIEVDASLLYADNGEPVEKPNDSEAPLLTSYDGIEFSSSDRPIIGSYKEIGVNRSWLSEDTKIKVGVVNAFCSRFSEEGIGGLVLVKGGAKDLKDFRPIGRVVSKIVYDFQHARVEVSKPGTAPMC
ncbi:SH2 domain-containing protein A [Vitis vinifera]|uniref:SH2 domain-containing protein A n=1 Tax=Vitis vinifera TaxID=29760 RepID=A0A438D6K5_VITVI|nr:SH2 domain-containing protein A [Vitis vinifera]